MTAPQTDDNAALRRVLALLQKTAEDGPDPFQFSTFNGVDAGVAILADHIDRCVLPQDAYLRFDNGQVVTLEACNRRFITLKDDQPLLTGAAGAICRAQGGLSAGAVTHGLEALCTGRRSVTIELLPDSPTQADVATGVPAEAIAPRAAVAPSFHTRVKAFLTALSGHVDAAFLWENDAVRPLAGSAAGVTALEDWAAPVLARVLDERFPLAASFETEGVYLFAGNPTDTAMGGHGFLACALGVLFAAHIVGVGPQDCLAAWQKDPPA